MRSLRFHVLTLAIAATLLIGGAQSQADPVWALGSELTVGDVGVHVLATMTPMPEAVAAPPENATTKEPPQPSPTGSDSLVPDPTDAPSPSPGAHDGGSSRLAPSTVNTIIASAAGAVAFIVAAIGVAIVLRRRARNRAEFLAGTGDLVVPRIDVELGMPMLPAQNPLAHNLASNIDGTSSIIIGDNSNINVAPVPPNLTTFVSVADQRVASVEHERLVAADAHNGALFTMPIRCGRGHSVVKAVTVVCKHSERKLKRAQDFRTLFDLSFGHVWSCAHHSGAVCSTAPQQPVRHLGGTRSVSMCIEGATLPQTIVPNTVTAVHEAIVAHLKMADHHIARQCSCPPGAVLRPNDVSSTSSSNSGSGGSGGSGGINATGVQGDRFVGTSAHFRPHKVEVVITMEVLQQTCSSGNSADLIA